MKTFWAPAFIVVASSFLWRSGRSAWDLLVLKNLHPHYFAYGPAETSCRRITDSVSGRLQNCEDIAHWKRVDSQGNLLEKYLVLSCDPGRKSWNLVMGPLRDPEPRGDLWLYMPQKGSLQRLALDGFPSTSDFHPLGISVYATAGQPGILFVVNHGRHRSTVEVFELPNDPSSQALRHIRTLDHTSFVTPNAVLAVSPTSVYISQDHHFTRRVPFGGLLAFTETILQLPLGCVDLVDFSGDEIRVTRAASNIPFANGIAMTRDGTQFAVASSSLGQIWTYNRDPSAVGSHLVPQDIVTVPFSPDNIHFDDQDTLYVAGHPHFPSVIKVARNMTQISPSWVVSLRRRSLHDTVRGGSRQSVVSQLGANTAPSSRSHITTTMYQSDGTGYSTSSSAFMDISAGTLYVSGLYADGILQCSYS